MHCVKEFLLLVLPLLSTGNLLKTQYDSFDSLVKIGQPLSTLKSREPWGAEKRGNLFIMAVTYSKGGLDRGDNWGTTDIQ